MSPLTSRYRDRIVDREVMKLRLREAGRRPVDGKRPGDQSVAARRQLASRVR
jgi:hypothetical protein